MVPANYLTMIEVKEDRVQTSSAEVGNTSTVQATASYDYDASEGWQLRFSISFLVASSTGLP